MRPESHKRIKREISAGVIIFRRTKEGPEFLLLYHGHGYWNFAKGKIEKEERSLAAALREVREETGLASRDLNLSPAFKTHERWFFKRGGQPTYKIVILYLAEVRAGEVKISREHSGYAWFSFREANRILARYRDSQRALKHAYDFLRRKSVPRHAPHPAR